MYTTSSSSALSEQPVIFSSVIESTLVALGPKLTPELRARVREAGVDLDSKQAAWPMENFLRAVSVLGEALLPEVPEGERARRLGALFVGGFEQTMLGKAAAMMAKVIGLRRLLPRMSRNFRATNNYLDSETVDEPGGAVRLTTRVKPQFHDFVTGHWALATQYRLGIFEAMVTRFDPSCRVELLSDDLKDTVFRFTWSEK